MSQNTNSYPHTLDDILTIAIQMNASDLHLLAGNPPAVRVSSDIVELELPKLSSNDVKQLTLSNLTNRQIKSFQEKLELDFSYSLAETSRFRGNLMIQKGTISAVYRIVPFEIPEMSELSLPPCVRTLCNESRGLILVTGPTGMGKSTTMASMINYINETKKVNIVTIEDPIEFLHQNKNSFIRQREVGFDTYSFSNALIHVLRHDPDIILVGEMRDLDSISIALTAAETGHLVISTLHTQTAPLSINRIIDVFSAEKREQIRNQLANSLKGIISQQLLPQKNTSRKALATEILLEASAVKNLIREQKEHQLYTVMQTNKNLGMHTMDSSICKLFKNGTITEETAFNYCIDKTELERLISL